MAKRFTPVLSLITLLLVSAGVAAQSGPFSIAIGDTVSDGVPAAGAGNIETAGAHDTYTFAATAGQEVIFDTLVGGAGSYLWRLETPNGSSLFDGLYADRQHVLAQTGLYTLTVRGGNSTWVGTYSFRLLLVPPAQYFDIGLGDTVSFGVPASGAGDLELPGSLDVYDFDVVAGTEVIFDVLSGGNTQFLWQLKAPDATYEFDGLYIDLQVVLEQTGTYRLTIRSFGVGAPGSYSFQLRPVETPQQFFIVVGDTISNGDPSSGAGNIELPGAIDEYQFTANAGQTVVFDTLLGDPVDLRWTLEAPNGASLFSAFFTDQQLDLPQTGTYLLTVRGLLITSTAVYSFRLVEAAATHQFDIAFGATVSDGVPGAGAGNIEAAGAVDVYRFDANAGRHALFDVLSGKPSSIWWTLTAPDATEVFDGHIADQQLPLAQDGQYTLTVRGAGADSTGTYSFALTEVVPNTPPVANDDEAQTDEDSPVDIDVLANDTDADDDALSIQSVTQPAHGTAELAGGLITYTPDPDFNGVDSFGYTASDGHGGADTATVTITVAARAEDGSIASTPAVAPGEQIIVTVSDPDLTGASIGVVVDSLDGENEVLTLSQTGPAGHYSGTFDVVEASPVPGNGSIETTGGTLTFTYIDAEDSSGAIEVVRTAITHVNGSVELLINGGFETDDDQDDVPDDWTPRGSGKNKRKCGSHGHLSDCALVLKTTDTGKPTVKQIVADPSVISPGDTLTISADVWTNRDAIGMVVKLVVKYAPAVEERSTPEKDKVILELTGPANKAYETLAESLEVAGDVSKIIVKLKYRLETGKVKLDNIRLLLDGQSDAIDGQGTRRDVLPLPEAPEGFRR